MVPGELNALHAPSTAVDGPLANAHSQSVRDDVLLRGLQSGRAGQGQGLGLGLGIEAGRVGRMEATPRAQAAEELQDEVGIFAQPARPKHTHTPQ